ncbi:MAG: IS30 family transposase [Candidatus Gastranaerophilales bacterium]|nr:IS30 family transposase [Candidatus Gastranaerophilales bacterium]
METSNKKTIIVNKGHLTSEEKDKLTILHSKGLSIRNIANILGRSPSTISRELKRKEAVFYRGNYIGSQTHINVIKKWREKHIRERIKDINIKRYIKEKLKYGYSPEIISGLLKTKYNISIHHETIYRYIYKTNSKLNLCKYLLRRKVGRKPRKKALIKPMKSHIPNRTDIDLRPEEINLRLETGHYECDSIESGRTKGKKRNSCLTVLVDRLSRKTIIRKTASKTSKETAASILKALKPYSNTVKSITYDNGLEFSNHEKINKELNIQSYFCKPYASYEKGTVENINGIIRRFFPKGTNFDTISEDKIKLVEDWINNRPMKILNYMTPNEKFQEFSVAIV